MLADVVPKCWDIVAVVIATDVFPFLKVRYTEDFFTHPAAGPQTLLAGPFHGLNFACCWATEVYNIIIAR